MFFIILIFSAMFFPGLLEFMTACRLALFYREEGGFLTFLLELLHGLLQPVVGLIVLAGGVWGHIELDLPVYISLPIFVIFLADRIVSAMMALWLAGIIQANWFRKQPTKEEMGKTNET